MLRAKAVESGGSGCGEMEDSTVRDWRWCPLSKLSIDQSKPSVANHACSAVEKRTSSNIYFARAARAYSGLALRAFSMSADWKQENI